MVKALIIGWLLGWSGIVVAADDATISFRNFEHLLTLEPLGRDRYRIRQNGLDVQLSNRILIGTNDSFDAFSLIERKHTFKSVKPIYRGKRQYWLAELFDTRQLPRWLAHIETMKGVELVQPDLMQVREKHATEQTGRHFEEEGRRDHLNPYRIRALPFLWQATRGEGVTIAVIDDGFDMQHPQLRHVKIRFSFDTELRELVATPVSDSDQHGTRVAGILFGAQDRRAPEGIAPRAAMIAIRQPDSWTADTVLAFYLAALAGADVINCSWNSRMLMQPVAEVIQELARNGRAGKGLPIVFSAGNEGREILPLSTEASIEEAIVVASYNQNFKRMDSSNFGEYVDFYALGQGITSTSKNTDYHSFGGTSLSASIVTGVIALLISSDTDISLAEINQRLADILPRP